MSRDPRADTTPEETRAMVDRTMELLRHQVGTLRSRPRPPAPASREAIDRRIETIRRQVLAVNPRPPATQSRHSSQPQGD